MTLNIQMISIQKFYYILMLILQMTKVHMIYFASYVFTNDITNDN